MSVRRSLPAGVRFRPGCAWTGRRRRANLLAGRTGEPARTLLPLAAAVLAAAAGAVPAAAGGGNNGSGGRIGGPEPGPRLIVYGYPYAAGCPLAGVSKQVDRWGMYECNCTSYVAWALLVNGQRIDWFIRGKMDARNWPRVARLAGFLVSARASVGAVAVWPKLTKFGHLAYVTALERDGSFDVAEYNLPGGGGGFVFDTRVGVRAGDAVFVDVPKRRILVGA